jgi:hypothetical protein
MRRVPAALVLLLVAACGAPRPPGGSGRLEHRTGLPDLLVLQGSPYQMGWWQGHLLRDRIRARAAAAAGGQQVAMCVGQCRQHLSERLLEELSGLVAATGLDADRLLRAEVARDALRMLGPRALVTGTAGLVRDGADYEARLWLGGAGAGALAGEALLVERRPLDGVASVALARPGDLGAWATVAADGRGYLLAEVEIRNRRRMGFGGGLPCTIRAREALGRARDAQALLADVPGTMGHVLLGFTAGSPAHPEVHACAGVRVYGAPDPPWSLGSGHTLAVGPFEDPDGGPSRALRAAAAEPADRDAASRWRRLAAQAGVGDATPRIVVRWRQGRASLVWRPGPGNVAREVRLERADPR